MVLFSRNFSCRAKFREKKKHSRNDEITLLIIYKGRSCPSREFLMSQACFNSNRENKTLEKISRLILQFRTIALTLSCSPMSKFPSTVPKLLKIVP